MTLAPSATPSGDTDLRAVEPVATGQGVGALLRPAAGPLVGRRREVDLDLGVGKDHRADVAALDHPSPTFGHPLPLALHEHRTHAGIGCHHRHHAVHLGPADGLGDVRPVDLDPLADGDGEGAGQIGHRGLVTGIDLAVEDGPGHRPVHGARVQAADTEPVGQGA